jgi:hypothetical protein
MVSSTNVTANDFQVFEFQVGLSIGLWPSFHMGFQTKYETPPPNPFAFILMKRFHFKQTLARVMIPQYHQAAKQKLKKNN